VMIGGMARNAGFVDSLKKSIDMNVVVPEDPDYMGALGAAEVALAGAMAEGVKGKTSKEKPSPQ